jgi:hypothetical protein
MFSVDEETNMKIETIDGKIMVTIKVKKESGKFLVLSFYLENKVTDKIISELVSHRAKL